MEPDADSPDDSVHYASEFLDLLNKGKEYQTEIAKGLGGKIQPDLRYMKNFKTK